MLTSKGIRTDANLTLTDFIVVFKVCRFGIHELYN